jgi:fibro-slime domain-containing protein
MNCKSSNWMRKAGAGGLLLACGLAAAAVAQQAGSGSAGQGYTDGATNDLNSGLPLELKLSGVVRDFKERSVSGGHPDFERQPGAGFGHYAYIAGDTLDDEGKPTFNSVGRKVTAQFKDASGRNVPPPRSHMVPLSGGTNGTVSTSNGNAVISAESFAQWFRDVPNVNVSQPLQLTLVRQPGSRIYTFNDRTDANYSSLGGFFPINGQLFGNSGGSTPSRNHHFTFELSTEFVYKRNSGQIFTFTGDDDVFVYVDGKCVIDLGGVHGAISQTIDLDRLTWLEDGKKYSLKFFFAERHRTASNFRIDTTLELQNAELPATSGLYD